MGGWKGGGGRGRAAKAKIRRSSSCNSKQKSVEENNLYIGEAEVITRCITRTSTKHAGRPADSDPSFFGFGWEGSLLCLEQWVVFFFCSSVKGVIVGMASSWHIMNGIASLANSRGVLSDVGGLAWSEWACSRLQERGRNFVGTYSSMRDNVYIYICMYIYIYIYIILYIYIYVQVFGNVLTCIDMLISIPMLQMWLFLSLRAFP